MAEPWSVQMDQAIEAEAVNDWHKTAKDSSDNFS